MIARIWSGMAPTHKADDYYAYLLRTGVADYRATPGNCGVQLLRRTRGDTTEFLFLTLWESWDAIRFQSVDRPNPGVPHPIDRYFQMIADRVEGLLQSVVSAKQFHQLITGVVVLAASFREQASLGFWLLFL